MVYRQGTTGNDLMNLFLENPNTDWWAYGDRGNDRIWTGRSSDHLIGGPGNDYLYGGDGDDFLLGGDDYFYPGGTNDPNNDLLSGGLGNDILNGAEGNDRLYSAAGNGTFRPGIIALDNNFTVEDGNWRDPRYPREVADVNGDGRADIVGFSESGVVVSLGRADGTFGDSKYAVKDAQNRELNTVFTPGTGWGDNNATPRVLGDINGDGRADIVGFGFGEVYYSLARANGTFLAPEVALGDNFTQFDGGWGSPTFPRYLADVNGDRYADIVGFSQTVVVTALSNGDGTFQAGKTAIANFTPANGGWVNNDVYLRVLGDINGDGRADIVGFGEQEVVTALGQADGTFGSLITGLTNNFTRGDGGWGNPAFPRYVADVNGDGWADIIGFGNSQVFVSLSKGNGTFENAIAAFSDSSFTRTSGFTDNNEFPRRVADVDGDGLADIVGFGSGAVFVTLANDTGGNDRLFGGAGDDIIIGGTGTKEAIGGLGADRFVLNPSGLMVIKDFQRDTDLSDGDQGDKIDVGGLLGKVRFRLENGNTLIILGGQTVNGRTTGGQPIARVEGVLVDSRDLLTTTSLQKVTAAELNDIANLVEKWADAYATSLGTAVSEIDASAVTFTSGDIVYANRTELAAPNLTRATTTIRNATPLPQTLNYTFADERNWSYTYQFTSAWKVSSKLSFKKGYEASGGWFNASKSTFEVNFEIAAEGGETKATTDAVSTRRLDQTSYTFIAPANATTTATIDLSGSRFSSAFTQPVFIGGTVDIALNNDSKLEKVPISAILPYYNPTQFQPRGSNDILYYELPNGDFLSYSASGAKATMSGQAREVILLTSARRDTTIFDYNITNTVATPEVAGSPFNQDRFWLALGNLPAATNPAGRITNFSPDQDQIGIVAPGITSISNLTRSSTVTSGVTTGEIRVGSRLLATLPGVDAATLTANNFVFNTQNSLFDGLENTSSGLARPPAAV